MLHGDGDGDGDSSGKTSQTCRRRLQQISLLNVLMACALAPVSAASSQLLHIINKHTVNFACRSILQHIISNYVYKV